MPVVIKESDITKFKGDAIINSIGDTRYELGVLCRNILTKAKDDSLFEFIYSRNRNTGTIEITDAGKLSCSKIIHVVVSHKCDEDNENNNNLVRIYKTIIRIALERGYKKIAIPLISSEFNGYTKSESYAAIMKASEKILEKEEKFDKDIIHITIIPYIRKKERAEYVKKDNYKEISRILENPQEFDEEIYADSMASKCGPLKSTNYDDELYDFVIPNKKKDYTVKEIQINTIQILKSIGSIKEIDMLNYKYKKYKFPFDFVMDYLFQKDLDEGILSYNGLGRKRKYKIRNRTNMVKEDVFKLSFLCKMTFAETMQFMLIADHSFNPYSDYDMFYLNYLLGKYGKVKDLIELDLLASKEGVETTFLYVDE